MRIKETPAPHTIAWFGGNLREMKGITSLRSSDSSHSLKTLFSFQKRTRHNNFVRQIYHPYFKAIIIKIRVSAPILSSVFEIYNHKNDGYIIINSLQTNMTNIGTKVTMQDGRTANRAARRARGTGRD